MDVWKPIIVSGLLAATVVLLGWLFDRAKARKLTRAATAYAKALDHLASNPRDPAARGRCLAWGRAFYAQTIPDTFTLVVGTRTFGTEDYQNNTAGREARIAADIEACIGHHRIPRG